MGKAARAYCAMTPNSLFPNLNAQNHRVTSQASADYNCIAWSAEDTEHWWQPGVYWPMEPPPGAYASHFR